MDMKEKQRILVDGKHWDGILKLPCFYDLCRWEDGTFVLKVWASYYEEKRRPLYAGYFAYAYIGDTIVEYDDGLWGVIRGKEAHDE